MSKAPQTFVCGALAGEEGFEPSAYGFGCILLLLIIFSTVFIIVIVIHIFCHNKNLHLIVVAAASAPPQKVSCCLVSNPRQNDNIERESNKSLLDSPCF